VWDTRDPAAPNRSKKKRGGKEPSAFPKRKYTRGRCVGWKTKKATPPNANAERKIYHLKVKGMRNRKKGKEEKQKIKN